MLFKVSRLIGKTLHWLLRDGSDGLIDRTICKQRIVSIETLNESVHWKSCFFKSCQKDDWHLRKAFNGFFLNTHLQRLESSRLKIFFFFETKAFIQTLNFKALPFKGERTDLLVCHLSILIHSELGIGVWLPAVGLPKRKFKEGSKRVPRSN